MLQQAIKKSYISNWKKIFDFFAYENEFVKNVSNIKYIKKQNTDILESPEIDYENLITEDDEPVDNIFSEREQKLLTVSLHDSWKINRPFIALANVGIYDWVPKNPVVPDVLLSLDVTAPKDILKKAHRTYMFSIYKKPPELVLEIVSDTKKKEFQKLKIYASLGIKYYVIHDPGLYNGSNLIEVYELKNNKYHRMYPINKKPTTFWFDDIDIGITFKTDLFQGYKELWLRWCDSEGQVLELGEEKVQLSENKAKIAEKEANDERQKAQLAEKEANDERQKAQLAEKEANDERQKAQLAEKKAQNAEEAQKRLIQHLYSIGTPIEQVAQIINRPLAYIEKITNT